MGMEIKGFLSQTYKREYFWLCLLILATLVMHFIIINNPAELILDEQHYVNDARNISANHTTERAEHPPLGKLIVVAGIKLFGDNPWGWRFFPIIFGTAGIALFYLLCRRLDMSRTASSIATFLLALENLTFLQASVAMLDVFYVTFMIAAFLLYANRKYIASGIAIGLSGLAKLNGALAGPVVLIHWIFTRRGRSWWFLLTGFFAVIVFVELMIPFDFAISRHFAGLADPLHRIQSMLSLSGSLTFANVDHPSASRPWDWLISWKPMAYWIMPHYTAAISFTIWALAIPTFAYMVWRAVKGSEAGLFGVAWFAGTFLLLIPLSIITDRVSYPYYFYPSVGAICIGLALGLSRLIDIFQSRSSGKLKWTALSVVIFILFLHLVSFFILSPLIPVDFARLVGITG
jgi:predicted membrane-bound dolichyl-phosphate-mannose-protein mannosyltransferase